MANRTDFRSDNVTGAAPEILAAITRANQGSATPYGEDALTESVEARLQEVFETDCAVFPVATGTAANALSLSVMAPAYGAIYCHELAHVNVDECGAPELFTGGAKLVVMSGAGAKISAADLADRLARSGKGNVHQVQAAAVSITQATELGAIYKPAEIAAIAEAGRPFGVRLHMDGARFANALAGGKASPADMTWRAGVTALSFGASKNGALAAEAVVLFDRNLAQEFAFRRKRAGHLFSKMRFLSAQLEAYLTEDLWLKHARHANGMAKRLADGLARVTGASFAAPVEANEIFVSLPEPLILALEREGFLFYRWDNAQLLRLVTAWDTDPADVDRFLAVAARHAGAAA